MNQINPMQILGSVMQNPQKALNQILGKNPMIGNLTTLINNKESKCLEEMSRNVSKEKGMDADKLYNQIKQQLGM